MLLGNLLIFLVAIVVVCLVDFSTIALDESTERLLYANVDSEEEVESVSEDGAQPEEETQPEEQPVKTTVEPPEDSQGVPKDDSAVPHREVNETPKSWKAKRAAQGTQAVQGTQAAKSDVGLGVDFENDFKDDFLNVDDTIDDIYAKGGNF